MDVTEAAVAVGVREPETVAAKLSVQGVDLPCAVTVASDGTLQADCKCGDALLRFGLRPASGAETLARLVEAKGEAHK